MTEHATSDWRHKASCRNDPDLDCWFASAPNNTRAQYAKAVCGRCPVRLDCADEAFAESVRGGIIAGFHTEFQDEWDALCEWLGRVGASPARQSARRTATCSQCGKAFVTKQSEATRCGPCKQGLVDAGPSKKRLHELRALGLKWRELGELLGMRENSVQTIVDPKRPYVLRETEAKIFAIAPTASAVKVA